VWLIVAELGDNTARLRVSSITVERTWPELGFRHACREERERERRWFLGFSSGGRDLLIDTKSGGAHLDAR
jgi:hypothetical protein